MTDVELDGLRRHDLPPAWDGAPVAWEGWEAGVVVFVCPPRAGDLCRCGDRRPPDRNRGRVDGLARLYASRCLGCQLDTVVDLDTGEVWTLDATDYGDAGSTPPPAPRKRPRSGTSRRPKNGVGNASPQVRPTSSAPTTGHPAGQESRRGRPPTPAQRAAIRAALHPTREQP